MNKPMNHEIRLENSLQAILNKRFSLIFVINGVEGWIELSGDINELSGKENELSGRKIVPALTISKALVKGFQRAIEQIRNSLDDEREISDIINNLIIDDLDTLAYALEEIIIKETDLSLNSLITEKLHKEIPTLSIKKVFSLSETCSGLIKQELIAERNKFNIKDVDRYKNKKYQGRPYGDATTDAPPPPKNKSKE